MSAPFEFSPVKLVYGGEALGYHEGRTVLVPRVLPGEQVEVETARLAKGVVHALPRRILVAAQERIQPPCPYFGRCGGCQYQHFSPERQTAAKVEILRETLRRLGKIVWSDEIPTHSGSPWNYRNQAQFKVVRQESGRPEIGFFEAESHRLFPVENCLILSPRLNAVLQALRQDDRRKSLEHCREVEVLADDRDEQVLMVLRGDFLPREGEELASRALGHLPGVISVAVDRGREVETYGQPYLIYRVGDFQYQVSATSFFQASRFLLPELVDAATRTAPAPVAFDLFCGGGLFTLPLARRFDEVVAVETHPGSVADLAANAHGWE